MVRVGVSQEMKTRSVVRWGEVVEGICKIVDADGIGKCKRVVGRSGGHCWRGSTGAEDSKGGKLHHVTLTHHMTYVAPNRAQNCQSMSNPMSMSDA